MSKFSTKSAFDDTSRYVDRFGLLLLVTIGAVVLQSLVNIEGRKGDLAAAGGYVLVTLFVGAMLLLALRSSGARRPLQITADVVVGMTLALAVLAFLVDLVSEVEPADDAGSTAPAILWMLLLMTAPLVVVRRLLQHRSVTRATMQGAIAAFLLIAVTFKFAFLAIDQFESAEFFGDPEPTTSFMYFSLVTVTTLGYGDLNAATELGRLAAVTEAVVGQIFLVAFVGMIVGLMVQSWRPRQQDRSDEPVESDEPG